MKLRAPCPFLEEKHVKRKRIEKPVPQQPVQPAVPETLLQRLPVWAVPALLAVLFYFGLFLPSGRMSMILVFLSLGLVAVFFRAAAVNLRERLSVPVLGLFAFMLSCGASAVYASAGYGAADEFVKLLASFSLALLALLLVERRQIRTLLWIFAAMLSFMAFVCIDGAGLQWFYNAFSTVMDAFGADFGSVSNTVLAGRINGIYNASNVTASIFALGGLTAVWLARSSEGKRARLAASFLTGICAMGFFLSMSRAAFLCFGAALVVYVLASAKEERLSLCIFWGETIVLTVLLSAIAMPFLGSTGSPIPDLMTLLCGPAIWAADRFLGAPLAERLRGKGKAIAGLCGAVVVLVAVYAVAAVNVTGTYTFVDGQRLFRTVELAPGAYTVSSDGDDGLSLNVVAVVGETPTRHQSETVYEGELAGASFTIPEGTLSVEFSVYGMPGDKVRDITLSDGTSLPLNYPLLPAFVANRLNEGLFSGTSFTIRLQYLKDGLTLFTRRPILGYGLGATQAWVVSVQPFYYESKYLHNQVVQVMAEQGLLGLISWLWLMVGTVWLLLRRLRQQRDPLAAMLLAAWVMMNTHCLMEFSFSIRAYQCTAFLLLVLMMIAFPQPLKEKTIQRGAVLGVSFAAAWLAFFGVTYEGYRIAQRDALNLTYVSNEQVMRDIQRLAEMDIYDPEQQRINFVANAMELGESRYMPRMEKYVQKLLKSGTYAGCTAVGKYYYLPQGDLENAFACSRKGLENLRAFRDAWNLEFLYYFEDMLPTVGPEHYLEFVEGVNATRTMLREYENSRLEGIDIAILVQSYLDAMDNTAGLSPEEGYAQLLMFVQENA